jgi:hypothetical protein
LPLISEYVALTLASSVIFQENEGQFHIFSYVTAQGHALIDRELYLPQQWWADLPAPMPDPTAALLELGEQVSRLQEQIDTLQQHIAELTRRLEPSPSAPLPAAATPRMRKKPSAASRAAAAARQPSQPVAVIPRVEYAESEGRSVITCPKEGVLPFEPDSQEWFVWVKMQTSFRFVGQSGYFSAHHEVRIPRGLWGAFRHIRNHTYRQRLAPSKQLTLAVLEQAAAASEAHAN